MSADVGAIEFHVASGPIGLSIYVRLGASGYPRGVGTRMQPGHTNRLRDRMHQALVQSDRAPQETPS
jgi:hypothetical protein